MAIFDEWLSRKLKRGGFTFRETRTVEEEYYRCHGPRGSFAFIRLTGEPCAPFEYYSDAERPDQTDREKLAMVEGIIDELLTTPAGVVTKVKFTLHAIKYHPVDSSPAAFYQAARLAARKIVDGNMVKSGDEQKSKE